MGAEENNPTTSILGFSPPGLRDEFFSVSDVERLAELAVSLGGELAWVDDRDRFAESLDPASSYPDTRIVVGSWFAPRMDAEFLRHFPRLELFAHTGATVRPFVSDESFARGIRVTQAGEAMGLPVAEVALTFTLNLLHQVHYFNHTMRTGMGFAESTTSARPQREIAGTAIGVVGASRTGRHYIRLALALGARISVYDPYLTESEAATLGVIKMELPELMEGSQIVAVHAPSLPETHHMIDAKMLSLLPDGAGLVNTARSWLVDEVALLAEVTSGRIDAALDVFDEEPLPADHPFRSLPNVLLTPHRAAGTVQGRRRGGHIVVAEIERHINGEPLAYEIMPEDLKRMA